MDTIVIITMGTMWGDDFDPTNVERDEFGTAQFTFTDCETGSVAIVPNETFVGLGFSDVAYTLERTLEPGIECPTPTAD